MKNPSELTGPVYPIPIPFSENEDVDFDALGSYCEHLVNGGAGILLVTVGTSRFNLLNREEMLEVNWVVADAVAGRATVVVSGPGPNSGSTRENIAFAEKAKAQGADAMIAVYPERWYGDDDLVGFFHDIAEKSPLPLWVHAVPMRDGFGGIHAVKEFELDALKKVTAHPNITGVKEENGNRELFEAILAELKDEVTVIGAGGAMRRFMKDKPLDAKNYLVGVESIVPRLGGEFFELMMQGRVEEAEAMAVREEDEFFEAAVKYGWHRSLKEALNIAGLMPAFERRPFTRIDESSRNELAAIIKSNGWI